MKHIRKGFTLVELLVVIAVLAILASLVIVAAGAMMTRAKSAKDMGNHKTLGVANWSHAMDHNGKMLHPRTGPTGGADQDSSQSQIDRFWVAAYGQDADGYDRVEEIGGIYVELLSSLRDGAAFSYIGNVTAFQSPLDPTIGDVLEYEPSNSNLPTDRIRSYAINAFVGVEWGCDDMTTYKVGLLDLEDAGYWRGTETISQIPQPSGTMFSIGEQDSWGRNGHGWLIHPTYPYWVDFPSFWNDGEVIMSFIDGSTGAIQLESDSLKQAWLQHGHNVMVPPAETEYKRFRKVLLPGVIGTVLDE